MNPLLKVLLLSCWTNMYMIAGICMGLSLSLFLVPSNVPEYQKPVGSVSHLTNDLEEIDEYEPKLNIDSKPQQAQKVPKAFIRPRYYSTELGIREKLFVGVITSPEYLYSRDIALNKTIAHMIDKIRYFISIPEGTKPNVSLPGIVGFTDTRSILKPFHALKYITDNYLQEYDYYFLVKDISYVNVRRLMELVNKISVSQDVHMGVVNEKQSYCSLDSGILLSNSLVQELKNNLDWCVKNTYSELDDVNFGRCVLHSTSVPCSNKLQGQTFTATRLTPLFNFDEEMRTLMEREGFENSITVYPIYDHSMIYKFNTYFTVMRLKEIQTKISNTREAIIETARLQPSTQHNVTWPIGNQPGSKPAGRFDILRWTYFNKTHTFLETHFSGVRELKPEARFDIDRVIHASVNRIIESYEQKLMFKSLVNGYQRFDASRGMDYILDIAFKDATTGDEIIKRIEVCKPLGKVEILPVPYVTENTRINMILVVNLLKKQEALNFLQQYEQDCMQKKFKTFLMIVLLYETDSPSKGKEDVFYDIKKLALLLTNKYKKDQSKITWLSIRLTSSLKSIEIEPMLRIAVADLCTRKFAPESLILFVETGMDMRIDYLNRVRMNTISQCQVFSPIPFVEFYPDIAYADEGKRVDIDINRNYGRYDEQNYNGIAFYVKDYNAMRKTVESSIPIVRSDKDILSLLKLSENSPVTSLFEMFVSFSDLHAFRAVEPALKIRYKELNCTGVYNNAYTICMKQKYSHLGNRGQLAKLVLDYQSYRSNTD